MPESFFKKCYLACNCFNFKRIEQIDKPSSHTDIFRESIKLIKDNAVLKSIIFFLL